MSINPDALNAESQARGSPGPEETLGEKTVAARREQWKRENAEAIAEYNKVLAELGIFSEGQRTFLADAAAGE